MDKLPQRKSVRLKDYNYSQSGYYFITICTQNRVNILCTTPLGNAASDAGLNTQFKPTPVGNVALDVPLNTIFEPTPIGTNIIECWNNISLLYEDIEIDEFCIMTNHIHGIIIINNKLEEKYIKVERKYGFENVQEKNSLQSIIRGFKSVTTRHHNKMVNDTEKNTLWQKSYYEHIIRNETELHNIREYIVNNQLKWSEDKYYMDMRG